MRKLKVMTIIGTRPEIIRLSEIIKLFDDNFNHILVHTGQNYDYELNEVFFKDFELREPDFFLSSVGSDLGETIGNIISKSYSLMKEQMPDALLILGDTNSALSVISAKRLKIPVFHMEAGNRCFDQNLPEEINRRLVDHISDVNLTYSDFARRNLLNEGMSSNFVLKTGSPIPEILDKNNLRISKSNVVSKLNLEKGKYIVLSIHREENLDIKDNFVKILNGINDLCETYDCPVIFSTHPRTMKKLKNLDFKLDKRITIMKPFGYFDYVKLQSDAMIVLSDSGTLPEESAYLGFPAVSIRTSTERHEAMEMGKFIVSGISSRQIIQSVDVAIRNRNTRSVVEDYSHLDVSHKVLKIVQSYTSIVNKMIWSK